MTTSPNQFIVVTGATGLQGRAVTRQLLNSGWRVRALTRNGNSPGAQALAALGAEIVQGDMAQSNTLISVFDGAYGVFSVQNPYLSGLNGEIDQGKNVARVAKQVGVKHLIYSSAGPTVRDTGVPSWESKLVVEDYMKTLDLPLTILRPMAFMELLTEKKFFPAVSTWQVMPKLMGSSTPVYWVNTQDLAIIVAKAFADPHRFLGEVLPLASDIRSIAECRTIYQQVMGKSPARFPLPVWLFERMGLIGQDLTSMWRWLGRVPLETSTEALYTIHPDALPIRTWLEQHKSSHSTS
ncbi:NmrA/HSCARG family protein [Nibrella saemangeumensis]|uniref:NmrA/HSCARG family protein n=1 Tax=Nibrella saemangeumensis TaxID=1084526 RepID=A0ABP8MYS1_9BACT